MITRAGTGAGVAAVPLASVDDELREAWHALAREAVEPNPFFAPELLLAAGRRLPGGADVRLFTVRDGERLLLALPLVRGRYRRMPLPALLTWRHPHRYVGTPLVHPDALDTAPGRLLAALAAARSPGWLVLDQLYVDGPVTAAFRRAAEQRRASWTEENVWDRPAVRARVEESYLDETVGARSRKTMRRQRRQLEEELGPVRAVDAAQGADGADVSRSIEGFLEMEAAGWKGRAATALASDAAHAAFWRQACQAFADSGDLELWELRAGNAVVARQCHVRQGSTVFHLKTTYDESLAKRSPGVHLELEVLHAFHEDPRLQLLDPCTEREPGTSSRLYPDTRRLGEALIGLTPGGRLAARLTPLAARAWSRLRSR